VGTVIMNRVFRMRLGGCKMQAKQTYHQMAMFISIKLSVADRFGSVTRNWW
jgi:hypothetical protein